MREGFCFLQFWSPWLSCIIIIIIEVAHRLAWGKCPRPNTWITLIPTATSHLHHRAPFRTSRCPVGPMYRTNEQMLLSVQMMTCCRCLSELGFIRTWGLILSPGEHVSYNNIALFKAIVKIWELNSEKYFTQQWRSNETNIVIPQTTIRINVILFMFSHVEVVLHFVKTLLSFLKVCTNRWSGQADTVFLLGC